MEKVLGKIIFAEYGKIKDYPFLIGLQLGFELSNSCGVMDGGKYTVNINPNCKWETLDRNLTVTSTVENIYKILNDAKVNYVSKLIDKPVEVTLENNMFVDFRILTEVI